MAFPTDTLNRCVFLQFLDAFPDIEDHQSIVITTLDDPPYFNTSIVDQKVARSARETLNLEKNLLLILHQNQKFLKRSSLETTREKKQALNTLKNFHRKMVKISSKDSIIAQFLRKIARSIICSDEKAHNVFKQAFGIASFAPDKFLQLWREKEKLDKSLQIAVIKQLYHAISIDHIKITAFDFTSLEEYLFLLQDFLLLKLKVDQTYFDVITTKDKEDLTHHLVFLFSLINISSHIAPYIISLTQRELDKYFRDHSCLDCINTISNLWKTLWNNDPYSLASRALITYIYQQMQNTPLYLDHFTLLSKIIFRRLNGVRDVDPDDFARIFTEAQKEETENKLYLLHQMVDLGYSLNTLHPEQLYIQTRSISSKYDELLFTLFEKFPHIEFLQIGRICLEEEKYVNRLNMLKKLFKQLENVETITFRNPWITDSEKADRFIDLIKELKSLKKLIITHGNLDGYCKEAFIEAMQAEKEELEIVFRATM